MSVRPAPRPTKPANPMAPPATPRMRAGENPFDDLIDESPTHGRFILLYSEAGEGKTTLAAQFPAPLFIASSGEQGVHIHKQRGAIPPSVQVIDLDPLYDQNSIPRGIGHPGWKKLMSAMTRFRDSKHQYKTLVIDSTSGLQDICFQHCASVLFNGDMTSKDFNDFQRGYTKAAEVFWSGIFMPLCLEIVAKGLNIVLISHSTTKTVANPVGPDYDQYQPQLTKGIFNYTKKDVHAIVYLGRTVSVLNDEKTKKRKAVGDRRFIGVAPNTYYIAKSWCGESEELDCGTSPSETYKVLQGVLGIA